jgi:quinolinate synthase
MSSFPTLTITSSQLTPEGSFAEAQAAYLSPDAKTVEQLVALCAEHNVGIVAHYYMDAELQGVLTRLPDAYVTIADSLKMADAAVEQAKAGRDVIVVLGVDFMSENVRAVLDAAGFESVAVYRLATEEIGCSLAESAEGRAYDAWLRTAAKSTNPLHVVYINTSLLTKAQSHHLVPTITCTSSNVVKTILTAAAQIPDVTIWYGPDTYMGANLQAMFTQFAQLPDEAIRALHPAHDRASLSSLLERFHYFRQGNCVVHHMFGDDVVQRVREEHPDALLTAHLEVPGEMFALAAEAAAAGRGVVGSTSNILNFILGAVDRAVTEPGAQMLPVVLGTEAGMVTSIVREVQERLRAAGRDDVGVRIIFPVASEAITPVEHDPLGLVPGVRGFEGCTVAGGCATCPFMKMNSLDALFDVVERAEQPQALAGFRPKVYTELIAGRTAADLGSEPILHMRHFQRHDELPQALIDDVQGRSA